MIKLLINNSDYSAFLDEDGLSITDQIQNKANTAGFTLAPGVYTAPSENQEVEIFDVVDLVTSLPTPWANWRMDEGSGSLLIDDSGNARHGTITGAGYATGKINTGLDFDGTDYVALSGVASLPTAAITVSAWVKADAFGTQRIIWADYSAVGGWILYGDATNWVFGIVAAGPTQKLVTVAHNSDGEWHHLVGTYDGTTQRLYYDGVEVGTPLTHTTTLISSGTFRLSHDAYDTFDGKMDEIRIYSTALTAAQVALLYATSEIAVSDKLRSGLSILDKGKFRVGQYFWLDVNGANEERLTISYIGEGDDDEVNIGFTKTALNSHSAGVDCGRKVFAGTTTTVKKVNPRLLTQVEYQISCTDYTKIFDKKNINDSWADVDARYIVNDALNTTINYNRELDDMDYADDAAVQAEWTESGDGTNPTNYTTEYLQGTGAVSFDWTNSGGTATFSATPTSADLSDLTGATSGSPTEGNLTFWYKRKSAVGISSIGIRVGSDSSNYSLRSFVPENDTDWHFISLKLSIATETGTPVWTAADYLAFVIAETTSSGIIIDDVRITAEGSFTMYGFEATTSFDDAHASFKKPTVFLQKLASVLSYYWFIDYDRDIHFFDQETNEAPFSLTTTSDNFDKLAVDVDTSQLKNRQVVRGGTETSAAFYTQVVNGDGAVREWILKNLFNTLTVYLDDNTSTDTMEATTTSTTVVATAHGLADGDYIVNRSRDNAVRKITYIDANTFTVEAVTSQASGDTFSKFTTAQTVGVENLVDETTVDYVSNYSQKSIRAGSNTATLPSTSFLLFKYHEVIPIRVQIQDNASITAMKALLGGDGIFDGAVITDETLDSSTAARDRAQAEISAYSNPIVKISFTTDYEGLESGQQIRVTDSNRAIDDYYVIQSVRSRYTLDYPTFTVQCASSLFGLIEYFQKLSESISERLIDDSEVIDQITGEEAEIVISESNALTATESVEESATITVGASETATDRSMTTDPYLWQPDASDARWNLAQWG